MAELSAGARKILDHLKAGSYGVGDYLPASRLSYLFDDSIDKEQSVQELVARGLVLVAPNGGIGVTQEGASWKGSV